MAADGVREAFAVPRALAVHRLSVLPGVAAGLRHWEAAATTIPDPALRAHALASLREKSANVEATAVFATLAPRRTRPAAVAAMTALQVAVDYLDTLGEQPGAEPLADGLALHSALVDALDPEGRESPATTELASAADGRWYRHRPDSQDGGYLASLVAACRAAVAALPGAAAALPAARRAVARCGEGQSHTHAAELAARGGDAAATAGLEAWARSLAAPPGYEWWELAAGASSSVAAHALIAAAADPGTSAVEAEAIDAVYFPRIGALTVILDDLVDRDEDLAAGAHSYVAYYADPAQAAERLAWIAERARAATAALPRSHGHRAILDGVLGFYLADEGARTRFAEPVRQRLLATATTRVVLIAAAIGRQQRRERPGDDGSASGPSAPSADRNAREESGWP